MGFHLHLSTSGVPESLVDWAPLHPYLVATTGLALPSPFETDFLARKPPFTVGSHHLTVPLGLGRSLQSPSNGKETPSYGRVPQVHAESMGTSSPNSSVQNGLGMGRGHSLPPRNDSYCWLPTWAKIVCLLFKKLWKSFLCPLGDLVSRGDCSTFWGAS